MPREIHTHYDNLKVARNAPIEVIRAAYKSLAAKYHPDRNNGGPEATRIMRIINASYEALCDPERKSEHDRWITSTEAPKVEPENEYDPMRRRPRRYEPDIEPTPIILNQAPPLERPYPIRIATAFFIVLALAGGIVISFAPDHKAPALAQNNAYSPKPAPTPAPVAVETPPRYSRPHLAPNDIPWPTTSGYLSGYTRFTAQNVATDATVTIDNGLNDSDFYIKIFDRGLDPPLAIRRLLLKAHDSFLVTALAAGNYDIRYKNLDSGAYRESEPFKLVSDDKHYSEFRITLYATPLGNTHFQSITEEEFGN